MKVSGRRSLVPGFSAHSVWLVVLVLVLIFNCPPVAATPSQRSKEAPLTLLAPVGTLRGNVSDTEIARWKRELRQPNLSHPVAARLHLWLGEIEIARNREPERALRQFQQAQHLVRRSSPVYGCAAYDRAMTLFFQGAYAVAAPAFHDLLQSKTIRKGYSHSECALWYRHAGACAGYHLQHAKLGITEPPSLDPLCGVASLAACMSDHGRPYDKKTLLTHCRMTGLGNNMQDLLQCARRLGMSAWTVKADEEGLKLLPKPLVAYVELDHFVAVTRANKDGVSYLCSDCGAWPGGRRDLTWKQWRAMDCNLYLVVALQGSAEARLMNAALAPNPSRQFVSATPATRLAALQASNIQRGRAWMIHLLQAHVILYVPAGKIYCGAYFGQECAGAANCPSDCHGASGASASSNGDTGPSAKDPVDLATGEERYGPLTDLTVYNPIGPSVVWQRLYGSLRGNYQVPSGLYPYVQNALGYGWNSSYDIQVIVSGSTAYLYFPNGSDYAFTIPSTPTASTPQVSCAAVNTGVPMLCTWNYNPDGSYSFIFTQTDRSQWIFSSRNGYALTRITDRNGNFINFVYDTPASPGYQLTAITDSNNRPLLTVHHNALNFNITSVSDRYGRSVYYTLRQFRNENIDPPVSDELTKVSQIVRTGTQAPPFRFIYGYTLAYQNNSGSEFWTVLHTITVPSPMGKGTATATINYIGIFVGSLVDANGNTRTYTPIDTNDTQVTVTDRTGKVVTSYTVGFDSQMRTTYRTDGTNKTQVYQASYLADNAYQPASVTNGNSQTTTYTYDQFGQVQSVTSPRNVTTTYTFDYSVFPLGELKRIQEGTKSPISISYYGPSGLVNTISTPLPGTSGSTQTATTSFTYDALGNVLTVTRPGNDSTSTITTTLNYTQDGTYSQPSAIGQPLTVTDNLGHVTHFRYDNQGNALATVDALGNRTDNQFNQANQLTQTLAPAVGDITNQIGVTRSQLTYVAASNTYNGTITLTNTGSQAIHGYLLCALTNLAPGVALANSSGGYVNSPTLLSAQVNLTPGGSTTLNVNFSAASANVVNYGVQTYLTDSLGNPVARRSETQVLYLYPGGSVRTVNLYDETGALYRQVNYGYGKEGELLSVTGSTEPVAYTYDGAYRLQTLADGNGNATQYAYNTAGWLASVTYPMGDGVQYPSYDADGHPLKRIDGRGIETDYTYTDPESLLTNVTYVNNANYPNVSQYNVTLGYDGYGRTQDVADFSGHTHLDYDDLDTQTEIDTTYAGIGGAAALPKVALTYAFNPDGSRHGMNVQTSTTSYDFTYGYDVAGRPQSLTNPFSETTQWGYLANNWLTSQTYANGVSAQYAYNRRGFLNDLTNYGPNSSPLSDFGAMGYDAASNRLTKAVTIPGASSGYSGQTAYTYDIKDQLTHEQSTLSGGYNNLFNYDPAGNPLAFKGTSHGFNADNQFTDSGFTYDGEGNPTTYNGTTLTFDPEDHMTAFGNVLTAGYRADDLRAWKQSANGTTYFVYDGITPVLELDGDGNMVAVNTFGANGLLSRHSSVSDVFYAFDPQGSTAHHLDTSGNVLNTSAFDAFGAGLASDPFGYGAEWGYYTDQETGLDLLGYRHYDTAGGRFITRAYPTIMISTRSIYSQR
jgi:YD repeat-containing protein